MDPVVRPKVLLMWEADPVRRPAMTQGGSRSPGSAEGERGQSPLGDRLPHSQCHPILQS